MPREWTQDEIDEQMIVDDDDADELDDISCGMRADDTCALAGTEWCDWSCPHSSEAKHNRRRGRRVDPRQTDLF